MLQNLKKKLLPEEKPASLENITGELRESTENDFDAAFATIPDIATENANLDEMMDPGALDTGALDDDVDFEAEDFDQPIADVGEPDTAKEIIETTPTEEVFGEEASIEEVCATKEVPQDILAELDAARATAENAVENTSATSLNAAEKAATSVNDPEMATKAISDIRLEAHEVDVVSSSVFEKAAPWIIWISLALVVASIAYAAMTGGTSGTAWLILGGGVAGVMALLLGGALTNSFSPMMLTSVLLHRARGRDRATSIFACRQGYFATAWYCRRYFECGY